MDRIYLKKRKFVWPFLTLLFQGKNFREGNFQLPAFVLFWAERSLRMDMGGWRTFCREEESVLGRWEDFYYEYMFIWVTVVCAIVMLFLIANYSRMRGRRSILLKCNGFCLRVYFLFWYASSCPLVRIVIEDSIVQCKSFVSWKPIIDHWFEKYFTCNYCFKNINNPS